MKLKIEVVLEIWVIHAGFIYKVGGGGRYENMISKLMSLSFFLFI